MAAETKRKTKRQKAMSEKKEKSVQGAEGGISQSNEADGAKQEHESAEQSDVQQLVDILARALKRGDQGNGIKRNVRPPRVYSVGQNFKTWHSQFVQYANLVQIKDGDRRAYLLTQLDQPAFKAVELLKLSESLTYKEFTDKLIERFDSGKTKEDYKLHLRARRQKAGEDFDAFADVLVDLAENAYPEADYAFKEELARDQFIQGVSVSDDIREKIFMWQPASIAEAVRFVRRLESARKACQSNPSKEKKERVNVISDDKISRELKELKELVFDMNKRIKSLEEKAELKPTSSTRRRDNLVCYSCKNTGHFARECKMNTPGNDSRGLPSANQSPLK